MLQFSFELIRSECSSAPALCEGSSRGFAIFLVDCHSNRKEYERNDRTFEGERSRGRRAPLKNEAWKTHIFLYHFHSSFFLPHVLRRLAGSDWSVAKQILAH